jgi:hypothetical protein
MKTKYCKSCDQTHSLELFTTHSSWCKPCTTERARWRHVKATYGLTKEDYQQLFESQNGKCAICETTQGSINLTDKLHFTIDHKHDNTRTRGTRDRSKIRGLLCAECNSALGFFKDDLNVLLNAVKYLQLHN